MADPRIEELLTGLTGSARTERAELIGWLLEQGVTVDEITSAAAPALLAPRRAFGDDGRYVSAREIAAAHGMDLELFQRLQRALGLAAVDDPDAPVHLRADAEAVARLQGFLDLGLEPDNLVQAVRVLGEGLANAAEVMRYAGLAATLRPGETELQAAQRTRTLTGRVVPMLGPAVGELLLVQLRRMMEDEAVTGSERAAGAAVPGARHIAVAFADLVGFTRLGEAVPPAVLEQLANRLADVAREVSAPPVRFVKTIGDAVMLVCPEPVPLLDATLRMVEVADADDDLLRLRAGIASGLAVSRAGDWFGSPVNLASRVTAASRPGAVLVTEPVREEVGDAEGFRWSYAGARHLKGIRDEVGLFRVRHFGSKDPVPNGRDG